ncbi:SDR family oxidoreductase [Actinoalloteichus hymeniacidonis]|uniref:Short-chain dehydrogenase n=1 Tax=Actinoalloteichus hymeniacidonis TaxID=340345 RepID=A0AAC9MZH1_9PSEU|nr:SDR family oxidoreductase [Actinoalloteichus hymeniacidonis]AOS64052.1 dehydrogenase of unknown specificity, short-chain alcohol dehydrogenase like [Actinoalloteichus hymeniacidonis]MBB5907886.1 NAD(P)-dependent dehydrogenase (short-subunit alcohol dehydrogenase family) [Actinoalloteichus hymeniacidonis]
MARTYVVTGAASGIGATLAEKLSAEGHRVIGADLRGSDIDADLQTTDGRAALVSRATELTGGRIDGVAAVAGLSAPIPATAAVNYFGAVATLEGLRPLLAESEAPRAAVVASLAAIEPIDESLMAALSAGDEQETLAISERIAAEAAVGAGNLIYNSSKRALSLWLRAQAPTAAWAGASIPLNAVAPGVIETPMIAELLATEEGRAALSAGAPAPLNGPAAPPAAPANLLAWLLSPENTHVTGQIIYVDGGAESIRRPDLV